MTTQEKARIILEELDKEYTIPSYIEEYAIKGIAAGLKKIEKMEEKEISKC